MIVLPEAIPDLFVQPKVHMYDTCAVATVAALCLLLYILVSYGATNLQLCCGCSFPCVAPAWRCRSSKGHPLKWSSSPGEQGGGRQAHCPAGPRQWSLSLHPAATGSSSQAAACLRYIAEPPEVSVPSAELPAPPKARDFRRSLCPPCDVKSLEGGCRQESSWRTPACGDGGRCGVPACE